jgi:YVTN family beta-propeller protein
MNLPRRAALTLPLAALAYPALAFAADDAPLAMVMNSGEASVSVIDMTTRTVVQTVPTYREPSHWVLSPDRSKLYIADSSGNALFSMDPLTGAAIGHRRMPDPYQLGYTPDQKYLVVNALRLDHVDVYDSATLAPVKRFAPGSMPSHLDFSPDSRFSFNSMQGSDTLVSFDLDGEDRPDPGRRALAERRRAGLHHGQRSSRGGRPQHWCRAAPCHHRHRPA